MSHLETLRSELAKTDRELLTLVARRQALVREIGAAKQGIGKTTRDFAQEARVIHRARGWADELGIAPELAEDLVVTLIRGSLTVQEQDRVLTNAEGSGRRVLIIGGAGQMGRWFARFLRAQGFDVEIADPAGSVSGYRCYADWRTSALDHEMIIVAAPLRISNEILIELADHAPSGVVFDVGSLKTPLRAGLHALRDAGVRVASVHPMFGPGTDLLSGQHVIFINLGDDDAVTLARSLFASTMAVQVEMDLESHDRLIAYVLGLSHAVNIAFFTALAESGEAATQLAKMSSTTFNAQLDVAARVAEENPHLYFEIQSLNDYGTESLTALLYAVERIRSVVRAQDESGFVDLMTRGNRYLARRSATTDERTSS